ncbi:MAG: hypothetical protein K2P79_10275 [Sphingomonas sp.]|nr:hypothetical protein [Sphingomonas sp.]
MSALPDDRIAGAAREDWLLLEYDYFKHLSTIALVALGAILTWIQGNPKSASLFFMIGLTLVAISAVLGFGAMNRIIDHKKTDKPLSRFFGWQRSMTTGTFATGLGMFMSEIGKALN